MFDWFQNLHHAVLVCEQINSFEDFRVAATTQLRCKLIVVLKVESDRTVLIIPVTCISQSLRLNDIGVQSGQVGPANLDTLLDTGLFGDLASGLH